VSQIVKDLPLGTKSNIDIIREILGNANRLKVLELLAQKPRTVTELAILLNPDNQPNTLITERGIRKILDYLVECGIIDQITGEPQTGGRKPVFYYIKKRVSGSFLIEPQCVSLKVNIDPIPQLSKDEEINQVQSNNPQSLIAQVTANYNKIKNIDDKLSNLEVQRRQLLQAKNQLYYENQQLTALLKRYSNRTLSYDDFGTLLPIHLIALYRDLQILLRMFDV